MFTVILDTENPVRVEADYFTPGPRGEGIEFYNRQHGESDERARHAVAFFPRFVYVVEDGVMHTVLRGASTVELLDELVWRVDHGGGAASGPVIGKLADVKESIGKLPGGLLDHRGEFK